MSGIKVLIRFTELLFMLSSVGTGCMYFIYWNYWLILVAVIFLYLGSFFYKLRLDFEKEEIKVLITRNEERKIISLIDRGFRRRTIRRYLNRK